MFVCLSLLGFVFCLFVWLFFFLLFFCFFLGGCFLSFCFLSLFVLLLSKLLVGQMPLCPKGRDLADGYTQNQAVLSTRFVAVCVDKNQCDDDSNAVKSRLMMDFNGLIILLT